MSSTVAAPLSLTDRLSAAKAASLPLATATTEQKNAALRAIAEGVLAAEQRILSAKDERHGLLATLWFTIAHYALRPWPWILVGFVGLLRYPNLANPEEGYVRVMVDILPPPFTGLLLAAFAAAYLRNPAPDYPDVAQRRGWEGTTILNVHVLANGRPDQVRLSASSGHDALDDAAVAAVTDWRFVPAKRGTESIDGWVSVPVVFKLGN